MSAVKVAFFEVSPIEKKYLKKKFDKNFELYFYNDPLDEENASLIKDADVVSPFIYSRLNEKVISCGKNLKLITTRSTGYNHIDLDASKQRGISVSNVPYYGETTVAEHTFALILALSRNLHKAYVRTIQGNFSLEGLRGFDIKDKTLGVVGAGSIGVHVIKIAKGFGMKVIAYDVTKSHILEELLDFRYVTLDELLENSDIISLHVPHKKGTHHLINMNNINKIKKGALFINTARSGIIEPDALYHAIDKGIFGGAGLDVFEGEELAQEENQMLTRNVPVENLEAIIKRNILLRRENVIITPHMAFDSIEAIERIMDTTAENIHCFLKNGSYNKII